MNGFLLAYGLPLGAVVLGVVVFGLTLVESRRYDRRHLRAARPSALVHRFDRGNRPSA